MRAEREEDGEVRQENYKTEVRIVIVILEKKIKKD